MSPPLNNDFASKFRRFVAMSCPENAQDWPMWGEKIRLT